MSLLAETLVEEWLNRRGYFTIRGARAGAGEMDLLAVKPDAEVEGGLEARHVEVSVSTKPIGYISPLTEKQSRRPGKWISSIAARTPEVLEEAVRAWVEKKFKSSAKRAAREKAWPGLDWNFDFVHGKLRHPGELDLIREHDIDVVPFHTILKSLARGATAAQRGGGVGTDIAEMLAYYVNFIAPVG